MSDKSIQPQIDEINQKLDLVLQYVNQQRLKSEAIEDLVTDVSIIGRDIFHGAVNELDNQNIELDIDEIKILIFKLIKNVGNFVTVLSAFESLNDFLKDAGPVANEVMIDVIKKMHEFEKKGYFEFIKELMHVFDNIITNYAAEDVRFLSNNIVTIMDTIKNMTQPEILGAMNNAVNIYKNLNPDDVEEYSMWKAFREMRTPEMKRGIGFIMLFLKNLSKEQTKT